MSVVSDYERETAASRQTLPTPKRRDDPPSLGAFELFDHELAKAWHAKVEPGLRNALPA